MSCSRKALHFIKLKDLTQKKECSLSNSSGNWLNDEFMSVEDYSLNAVTEKTIIMYIFIFLEMAKELGQQLPTCKFCKMHLIIGPSLHQF